MMTDRTCRNWGCQEPARNVADCMDLHAASFCSPQCEVKYDHIRDDAQDARATAEAAAERRQQEGDY